MLFFRNGITWLLLKQIMMMEAINQTLEGSVANVWSYSKWLILYFLFSSTMVLTDRLFLSHYASSSLNIAALIGSYYMAIILPLIAIASIAEVFVSRYNGARLYNQIPIPVWQMIYFAVAFGTLLIPLFLSRNIYFINEFSRSEREYLQVNLFFSPFWIVLTAISAFFIGTGKGMIVQLTGFFGNLLNIALDPIFIFGISGKIPEMGATGAALATGIGILAETIFLLSLFLKKKNRDYYQSGKALFNVKEFLTIIKVGVPSACFIVVQLGGWAIWFYLVNRYLNSNMLIASSLQSLMLFFIFFGLGLEKGVVALSGNLIGSKKQGELNKTIKSSVKISLCFYIVLALGFYFFQDALASLLINPNQFKKDYEDMRALLQSLALFLLLESIKYSVNGVLTALKETVFIFLNELASVLLLFLVPSYLVIITQSAPFKILLLIWLIYTALSTMCSYFRYRYLARKSFSALS